MIKDSRHGFVKWSVLGLLMIVLIAVVVVTSMANQGESQGRALPTEVKNISLRVAEVYKATNTQIVRAKSTQAEVTNEPMYIVNLTGEFQKGNLRATNLSFSILADGKKVWALRAFDNNNKDIWQEAKFNLTTDASGTNLTPATGDGVDVASITMKYLKDHGYSISNETGGGNLAGAKIQLPNSFNAVLNNVKIGELLKEKNELSKRNEHDFSKYLGQNVSIFTWGLDATADSPYGLNVFFLIHGDDIVGVWFEPNKYGEKNTTLSIFESIQTFKNAESQ